MWGGGGGDKSNWFIMATIQSMPLKSAFLATL